LAKFSYGWLPLQLHHKIERQKKKQEKREEKKRTIYLELKCRTLFLDEKSKAFKNIYKMKCELVNICSGYRSSPKGLVNECF